MLSPPRRAKHPGRVGILRSASCRAARGCAQNDGAMPGRHEMGRHRTAGQRGLRLFHSLFPVFSAALFLALLGCAAPGEPRARRPPVPEAVTDLAARQAGDGVVLTFTLPRNTVEHQPMAEPPAVEIYRGLLPAGAQQAKLSTRLVYTIPASLVDTYLTEGRVRFMDPLKPEELTPSAGGQIVYMVRTRASKRRASADSNTVALRVYPAPAPIGDLQATLTESAVELTWTPPTRTAGGATLPALVGYRVYRAEVEPAAEAAAAQDPSRAKLKMPLELLGPTPSAAFRDTQFEFGHTYLYSVRSVAQYAADEVESADSRPAVVTPRDTFPPAAPSGLVAIVVPETPQAPMHVELSWGISPEPDWAGYRVYRGEQTGPKAPWSGELLTRELLLAPTFRDMSVTPGRRYLYRVSALDRAGNESPLSTAVSVEVPQPEP